MTSVDGLMHCACCVYVDSLAVQDRPLVYMLIQL
jgi:hypothetical protein